MLGKLPSFDYYRPSTLDEALTIVERLNGDLSILAGGTDLLVAMKERRGKHPALLDIKSIHELSGIRAENGNLFLGATATTRAIAASSLVRERWPLLSQALKFLGSMHHGRDSAVRTAHTLYLSVREWEIIRGVGQAKGSPRATVQSTEISSTSKISALPGGTAGPAPRSP